MSRDEEECYPAEEVIDECCDNTYAPLPVNQRGAVQDCCVSSSESELEPLLDCIEKCIKTDRQQPKPGLKYDISDFIGRNNQIFEKLRTEFPDLLNRSQINHENRSVGQNECRPINTIDPPKDFCQVQNSARETSANHTVRAQERHTNPAYDPCARFKCDKSAKSNPTINTRNQHPRNNMYDPCARFKSDLSPKSSPNVNQQPRNNAYDPCARFKSGVSPKSNPNVNQHPQTNAYDPCARFKSRLSPKSSPTITGDPKIDLQEKIKFNKIHKIELDRVLEKNVLDLSVEHFDRDPLIIAKMLNGPLPLYTDPFENVERSMPVMQKQRLDARDIHHVAPGSMIPNRIPVSLLNVLNSEVLDEYEAILSSQAMDYPDHNILADEIKDFDISKIEREIPIPKQKKEIFKCNIEVQPLRHENFFQLRGSDAPSWNPGIMSSFPDGEGAIRMIDTPEKLLNQAWKICGP